MDRQSGRQAGRQAGRQEARRVSLSTRSPAQRPARSPTQAPAAPGAGRCAARAPAVRPRQTEHRQADPPRAAAAHRGESPPRAQRLGRSPPRGRRSARAVMSPHSRPRPGPCSLQGNRPCCAHREPARIRPSGPAARVCARRSGPAPHLTGHRPDCLPGLAAEGWPPPAAAAAPAPARLARCPGTAPPGRSLPGSSGRINSCSDSTGPRVRL